MSDIDVKQGLPLSPTLIGLYNDELETHLDEINGVSPCLFNTIIVILLNGNDVVLLSRLGTSRQRLLSKLYEACNSSSLEVNLSKIKIMIFSCNKRKLNQEAFYLDKDPIEITHEYKFLEIDFCSSMDEAGPWPCGGARDGGEFFDGKLIHN